MKSKWIIIETRYSVYLMMMKKKKKIEEQRNASNSTDIISNQSHHQIVIHDCKADQFRAEMLKNHIQTHTRIEIDRHERETVE